MAMTSLSVILAVFVLHIHHRGSLNRRAPMWLRKLSLQLGTLFYVTPSPYLKASIKEREDNNSGTELLRPGIGSYNHGFRVKSLRNVTLTALENGEYLLQRDPRKSCRIRHAEDEVIKHLRYIIEKHDREEVMNCVNKEWEDIAVVCDRFLFWLFFLTALAATLALLVFKPLTKNITIVTDIID